MSAVRVCVCASALALLAFLSGCTPSYTEKAGYELAGRAGITDSVSIERGNQRLLSRQGRVCLLSDIANSQAGQALLRTMQNAFSGHFVDVVVEAEAQDYRHALNNNICPDAAYLLFVQSDGRTCFDDPALCGKYARSQFIITAINRGDQSLLDRIRFSVRNSWLPLQTDNMARLQKAFEQLAVALTGGSSV